jgi:hypothetical protein
MIEDIAKTFELIGVDITFLPIITYFPTVTKVGFIIKAIPEFTINTLFKEASTIYEVEVQTFYFTVQTSDCKLHNIDLDQIFTLFDGTYIHTFRLDGIPVHDLTGYSRFTVDWVSKV